MYSFVLICSFHQKGKAVEKKASYDIQHVQVGVSEP